MAKKLIPFINRFTGEVKVVSKKEGKQLSEDYSEARFTKNEQGVPVMRFEIDGGNGVTAIVDVSENDEPIEVDQEAVNGKRNTK